MKNVAVGTQLQTISSYLKQAHVRQKNAKELRKSKTATPTQMRQAESDAMVYALIAHTMALENDRLIKQNGQAVYE